MVQIEDGGNVEVKVVKALQPRRQMGPEQVEQLLMRASLLAAEDQALLRALFQDGRASHEVAAIMGTSPRGLRRRARRLAMRVLSPQFTFVLQQRRKWAQSRRRIATAVIVQGHSMREAAELLGLSLHTVRRHVHAVMDMCEGK